MKSKSLLPVFALFLLGVCSVIAQEKQYPEYNCAITPPTGWNQLTNLPPQDAFFVAFANKSKTRLFMLIIDDKHKTFGEVNDRFVSEFEKGVESTGMGKRLSGKFIEVAGLKGYERLGQSQINGKNASTLMRVVPADGRFYSIQAMRFDGEAGEDAETRAAMGTFRFITPPRSLSAAYRTGYMIGKFAPIVLVGIGALIAVLIAVSRQKAARRQQTPPPLPPNVPPPA